MQVVLISSCLILLALTDVALAENIHDIICNQEFVGYSLDYQQRKCIRRKAKGCVDPFPYQTKHECMNDFKGEGNVCASSPCQHGGMCLPITTHTKGRTFKCDCYATGYYGSRCHRKCPRKLNRHSKQTACIQIW